MLKFLMMPSKNATKTWFGRMWTLALLAVFTLVASPAFASSCCCDDMAEAGHSHEATHLHEAIHSQLHDTDSPTSSHYHAEYRHAAYRYAPHRAQVSGSESCDHQQCAIAPLVLDNSGNKNVITAPLWALSVQPFSLSRSRALVVAVFENAVARPRAPDRWTSSGLAPPAPFTS